MLLACACGIPRHAHIHTCMHICTCTCTHSQASPMIFTPISSWVKISDRLASRTSTPLIWGYRKITITATGSSPPSSTTTSSTTRSTSKNNTYSRAGNLIDSDISIDRRIDIYIHQSPYMFVSRTVHARRRATIACIYACMHAYACTCLAWKVMHVYIFCISCGNF